MKAGKYGNAAERLCGGRRIKIFLCGFLGYCAVLLFLLSGWGLQQHREDRRYGSSRTGEESVTEASGQGTGSTKGTRSGTSYNLEPETVREDYYVLLSNNGSGVIPFGDQGVLSSFLKNVTITDSEGKDVGEGGILYSNKEYTIHLDYGEDGTQFQQFNLNEDGTLTFRLPSDVFKTRHMEKTLYGQINGTPVELGTVTVDENGLVTVKIDEDKRDLFWNADQNVPNMKFGFDVQVTAAEVQEGKEVEVKFDDAGTEFKWKVVAQPQLTVEKTSKYDEETGLLDYTVSTKVERGPVTNLVVKDELTPPQSDAITVVMVKDGEKPKIKVTVKKNGVETKVELTEADYELVQEPPDPNNPHKPKTFKVRLKTAEEGGRYESLETGDELLVSYQYQAEYHDGVVGTFWGQVSNEATVTGKQLADDPADEGKQIEIPVEQSQTSEIEIHRIPPGNGVVYKEQEYNEYTRTLHYTLYTVVPKGTWSPLYIFDDTYVQYGGKRWYLTEFKENNSGRVKTGSLKVSAVDLEGDWLKEHEWEEDTDVSKKREDLKTLKENAKELKGYDFYEFNGGTTTPKDYEPSIDKYVYRYGDSELQIIFGARSDEVKTWGEGAYGSWWGHWSYDKDRLIITEYDLDMSDGSDLNLELKRTGDEIPDTFTLPPGIVRQAGITNNVFLQYDKYRPGYSVFFNNKDQINKTGKLDKNDNTIKYTVSLNLRDETVWDYFHEFQVDWQKLGDPNGWDYLKIYLASRQVAFYDDLPDGWKYVDGTLCAAVESTYGSVRTFSDISAMEEEQVPGPIDENGNIYAPLGCFRNEGRTENLFDMFSGDTCGDLATLSFTYTVKATDEWLEKNGKSYKEAVDIINKAEITDKEKPHRWTKDHKIPYVPAKITKKSEQVGNTARMLFTLEVNPLGDVVNGGKPLTVRDASQNLNIDYNTIKITDVTDAENTRVLDDTEYKLTVPPEGGHFELEVPDGMHLQVTYEAVIIGSGVDITISNKASINGVDDDGVTLTKVLTVDKMKVEGSGSKSKMKVVKQDAKNGKNLLGGAEFDYYIVRVAGSQLEETKKITINGKEYSCFGGKDNGLGFTTREDGSAEIMANIEAGNYYIFEETKAPEGYELDPTPILVYFGQDKPVNMPAGAKLVVPEQKEGEDLPVGVLYLANTPMAYELPETGGFGTAYLYLMGSAFVLMGGAFLLYDRRLAHRRAGR